MRFTSFFIGFCCVRDFFHFIQSLSRQQQYGWSDEVADGSSPVQSDCKQMEIFICENRLDLFCTESEWLNVVNMYILYMWGVWTNCHTVRGTGVCLWRFGRVHSALGKN